MKVKRTLVNCPTLSTDEMSGISPKTGGAVLSPARQAQLLNHLPKGTPPVQVIRIPKP